MKEFKAPDPLKSEEVTFEKSMESMITLMSRMYKNQVILELDKGTVEKFADAQVGNYAAVLTKLANSLQRKLLKRFSNARLKEVATKVLASNDRRSKKLFYEHAAKSLGVDPLTLMNDGTQHDMNALIIETTAWAKKLRDQTLEEYTANTLRAMTLGESVETILEKYDGLVEKRRNHAEFTARNQIANTNSIMNKTRAQKLGVTKAI